MPALNNGFPVGCRSGWAWWTPEPRTRLARRPPLGGCSSVGYVNTSAHGASAPFAFVGRGTTFNDTSPCIVQSDAQRQALEPNLVRDRCASARLHNRRD